MGGHTVIRLTARWQTTLDERILERLRDVGETNVPLLAAFFGVGRGIIRDRLRMLAQVELVEIDRTGDRDWYDLTYWGILYLAGDFDVNMHPRPTPDAAYTSLV